MQAERGLTYLFISHDLKVVRALAHRVLVMGNGVALNWAPRKRSSKRRHHHKNADRSGRLAAKLMHAANLANITGGFPNALGCGHKWFADQHICVALACSARRHFAIYRHGLSRNQIATDQIPAHGCAQHGFLHVAIARQAWPHMDREICTNAEQSRPSFAPAPKIRHADETFRDRTKSWAWGVSASIWRVKYDPSASTQTRLQTRNPHMRAHRQP